MKEKNKYDYCKLRGKIKEVFDTQSNFADAMKLSETSMTNKLNNLVGFTQDEIIKACTLLKILTSEIGLYFFTIEVEK